MVMVLVSPLYDGAVAVASVPAERLTTIAEKYTTNPGHPGNTTPVMDEIYNTFLIPQMFAEVAQGKRTVFRTALDLYKMYGFRYFQWKLRGYAYRKVMGKLPELAGKVMWGTKANIGYYSQNLEDLEPRNEVIQELRAGPVARSEQAEHGRGRHDRAGLADAAHRHAQVLALDDHDDAARLEDAHQRVRDLGRHALSIPVGPSQRPC